MNKTKSISISTLSVIVLLIVISTYTILVFPRFYEARTASTLVFEEAVVTITPIASPKVVSQQRVMPKATPVPLPIIPSKVLSRTVPVYPSTARVQGVEGIVVVKALIDSNGFLVSTGIKKSSGSEILDSAAIKSLNKWSFSPAKNGIQPIKSWLEIPFKFRLR